MLQELNRAQQQIDDSAKIDHYALTSEKATYGYVALPEIYIKNAAFIPKVVSKLTKFFPQFKPKRGKPALKMHFTFSESIDDIIDDLREELSHTNFTICKKNLQYWDLSLVDWVVYCDPRGDTKRLTECLVLEMKKIRKFDPVFDFKVRRIFNGATKTSQ